MSDIDYIKQSWNALLNSEDEQEKETQPIRRATKGKMKSDSRENSSSRKKSKPNNCKSDSEKTSKPLKKPIELEADPQILQRRQKQIDYGKNTVGYYNYTQQVPIDKRTKEHPKTPDKYAKYSRRSWDRLIKMWRIKLHKFDSQENECDDQLTEKLSDTES